MNKQEFIKAIAQEVGMTQVQVGKVIDCFEQLTYKAIANKDKIQWTGFINIKPVYRSERKGYDPIRKEAMDIAPTVGISVKAGEKLRKSVEGLNVADFYKEPKVKPVKETPAVTGPVDAPEATTEAQA